MLTVHDCIFCDYKPFLCFVYWFLLIYIFCFHCQRDVRLSPYAVSAQENSNPRLKRSKSGRQRHGSHGAVDGSHWGSTPQTITAWVDNTGWKPQEGRPKRMNRPVSAPAFRNRLVLIKATHGIHYLFTQG